MTAPARYVIGGIHGVTPAGFHEYVAAEEYDKTRKTLDEIFEYFGPPQDDCECLICDLQRERHD